MERKNKRKTRPQRRFFKVGIGTSIFAVIFLVGTIISACNLSHRTDLNNLFGNDYIENLIEGENNSYYTVTSTKNSSGVVNGGFIYHYDKNDKLVEKVNVFEEAKNKWGLENLSKLTTFYPSYESDKAYIASGNYLFSFAGLNENSLSLVGYTNQFVGEIKAIASSTTDLYVYVKDGSYTSLTRFNVGDNTFTPQATGTLYENFHNEDTHRYELKRWENVNPNTVYVNGNYVFIFTQNYSFVLHKDLTGCNYKYLFNTEFNNQKVLHPEKTDAENKQAAKTECLTKYGWADYDYSSDKVTLFESSMNPNKFEFFIGEDKMGTAILDDKVIMVGRNRYFYSCDIDELLGLQAINDLDEALIQHYSVKAPYTLSSVDNVLTYYNVGERAIVRYSDSTDNVSIFNLRTMKFENTLPITTRIYEGFYNEVSEDIYYKYVDSVNKETGRHYISKANVPLELKGAVAQITLVVFACLLAATLIASIVCFSSFGSKKAADKVMQTGKGIKKHWPIYVIIIPSFAILCLFCYYPGISAIITSFFNYQPGVSSLKTWNNFANYVQIFGNVDSLRHFGNMLIFLAADIVIATIPPLIFAFFLSVLRFKKFSGVLRTLLFIPGIIPGVAGVLIWTTCIYGPYGLLNTIIVAAGGTPVSNFFDSQSYWSILSIIMMGFPFVGSYLIFYGSMMNIPKSYYEAAEIDGITVWKRFIKIDLPLSFPQLKYVFIMTIIASIQNFSRIWIAMSGTPGLINTPITKMYELMYKVKDYGLASAYATVLFIILFGLTFVSMRKKASGRIK